MEQALVRWRRRLSLAAATVLALALVPASAAFAAANYSLSVYDGARGGSEVDLFVYGSKADVAGASRLVIRRGGAIVADKTGDYNQYGSSGYSEAFIDTLPAVGDVLEIYNPASASSPARTYNYTGRPTLDSCPVGSRTVTGTVDPNTSFRVGAFRPSAQSGDPTRSNPGVVTQSGQNYTATLARPLASGDIVSASGNREVDQHFTYGNTVQREAGACAPASPPAPVTVTPAQPVTTVLDGVVDPLRKSDVRQGKNPRLINVRIRCDAASTIPCKGTAAAQTVRRFAKLTAVSSAKKKKAKKKRITLAAKKFSVAPGQAKTVKLKLSKAGFRLLKHKRSLKVRVSVVTKDSAGKRLAVTRTLTLKYKKPKKK
jgi:hypothetical protein